MVDTALLFTQDQLSSITGATLSGALYSSGGAPSGTTGKPIVHVTVDSRTVSEGSLFVALEGERTDGHRFLNDAARRGAVSALIRCGKVGSKVKEAISMPIFEHDEPLQALHALAAAHLKQFPDLLRVAVTGSSGKTTSKELLGSVLSAVAPTAVSEGNLNSDIGLPLALFSIRKEHRYGVFELGINRKGEMDQLSSLYQPHMVLITNIGVAHSGPLGGADGVFFEKGRVFSSMTEGGYGFLPEDEERIESLAASYPQVTMLPYGPESILALEGIEDLGLSGWNLHINGRRIHLPLSGRHNLMNACGVLSLSLQLGIDLDAVERGFLNATAVPGRCRMIEGVVSILDDSYNANPDSLEKMLNYFSAIPWKGDKIAVLGAMKELGEYEESFHRGIAKVLSSLKLKAVLLYGRETEWTVEELSKSGFTGRIEQFIDSDFERLKSFLIELSQPGDLVLLKGSRVLELERLIPLLEASHA